MHSGTQNKSDVLVRRKRIEIHIIEIITLYHLTAVPNSSTVLHTILV